MPLTYFPAGGAMRIDNNVYYVLRDRLGSAYTTTDSSGTVIGEMRYYASGETLSSSGSMLTDRLFTGQRWNANLGIYQFGARFYSPTLGRFLSADTMVPQPYNPQSLNRFTYALNNPVRYSDPTGHWIDEGCGGCSGGTTTTSSGSYIGGYEPPSSSTTTYTTSGGGGGGGGGGSSSGSGSPAPSVNVTYLNSTINALYGAPASLPTFRPPDYWAGQLTVPIPNPLTETLVGVTISATNANNHTYIGIGPGIGKTAIIPVAINANGGWLLQSSPPSASQMEKFLTGWTANVSGGFVPGIGGTWGNVGQLSLNDFAGEGGLYSPQIGASATYTVVDITSTSWRWLP